MRQRAARFQTDFRAPEYGPAEAPEDEQKKAQRAARFGTQYAPPGALMDIGAPHAPCAILCRVLGIRSASDRPAGLMRLLPGLPEGVAVDKEGVLSIADAVGRCERLGHRVG